MRIFKFGGASVRHAAAIQKVANIVKSFKGDKILVVVSAMGKTTNALERLVATFQSSGDYHAELQPIKAYHEEVIQQLFPVGHPIFEMVAKEIDSIVPKLNIALAADKLYDQVVSIGEVLSSMIVAEVLKSSGLLVEWVDARKYIATDSTWREGRVNWSATEKNVQELKSILEQKIVLTQGFIGRAPDGSTTTLGREGSDYTAAIFAACLHADSVTIWKDVPGVMNADPKRISDAVVFDQLPFREAAEMTYYGASVIHPKTIKPLANKNIPLYVKSFDNPALSGTMIHETTIGYIPPLVVFKDNQCLVSCRVTDYTFIDEEQLGFIFNQLSQLDIKINVMQNSAISFSFCIDFREDKVMKLVDLLAKRFSVYYNTGLTLITIKNYDLKLSDQYRKMKGVILEQSSRSTLQVLVKN